jgi:hypothetical protein
MSLRDVADLSEAVLGSAIAHPPRVKKGGFRA